MIAPFQIPSTVILGGGASLQLAPQAQQLKARRALLVTDAYMVASGLVGQLSRQLGDSGIAATVFADVQPDPTVKNVMDGLVALTQANAELVVGVGGGSPMDAAKAIAVLATNPAPLAQYAGYDRIPRPGLPLILIPTTAGTGSEVTRVAVITDTDRDVKMMLLDAHLLPRIAIVDFELTLSMPRQLTAHVGVDTLTHGLEAYVSQRASPLTDPMALSCIKLVAENLDASFREPMNRKARESMMVAACQGGMAFSNSSVALVHGMSRPIGAHFHVPHGLSNAVLLPEVTRFSIPGAEARYATAARVMNLATSGTADGNACEALLMFLDEQNRRLEIGRLRDAVKVEPFVFESKLDAMAEAALASGSPQNNPRVPAKGDIIELYRRAW